jgi:quercetin dioxygenase-like cupin family protein
MKTSYRRFVPTHLLAAISAVLTTAPTQAGDVSVEAVKFTPSELQWKPSPRVTGLETADMISNSNTPGAYLYRVKFPPNFKMQAHGHPDERHYAVLSGTWYLGWGKKFDKSQLIALPAGSFYTEPANIPHFVMTRDDGAVIQVGGQGPTSVNYVDPAHAPKKK